ncbi:unnamed protein product [Brassica rapa subsp. narinosa]
MLVSSPPQRRAHSLRSGTRYTFGHGTHDLNTRFRVGNSSVPIDDDKEYIEAIKEASFGVQQSVFVNCFVQCCFQIIP